ncbi:MAG: Leu/Phe/Val dehydrogenase [Candidatus Izemoplasmataceae bacterium]
MKKKSDLTSDVFNYSNEGFEQIIYFHNKETGLKGITCIHDTRLGPACGGTRLYNYSCEEEALYDVTRLAKGMTYKNAAAGLNIGGCKTVIIGDPKKVKSEEFFRSYGRYIQSLNGRVYTGQDMNITLKDCEYMDMETDYVSGVLRKGAGSTTILTARGVYVGMLAAVKEKLGKDNLDDLTIAFQGVGAVVQEMVQYLQENHLRRIYFTDIDQEKIAKFKKLYPLAIYVEPDEIYGKKCDIFSPNAIGAILNDDTIPQLRTSIIAGAANNVLKEERHGDMLEELGILYAPDFVINAGGVINVYHEMIGYHEPSAIQTTEGIYDRLMQIFHIAKEEKIPTYKAANILAERRIEKMMRVQSDYVNARQKFKWNIE